MFLEHTFVTRVNRVKSIKVFLPLFSHLRFDHIDQEDRLLAANLWGIALSQCCWDSCLNVVETVNLEDCVQLGSWDPGGKAEA